MWGSWPCLTLLSSFTARRGCQPCGDPPAPTQGPHGGAVAEPSRRAVAAAVGCGPGGASSFGLCWSQPRSPLPGRPPPCPSKVRARPGAPLPPLCSSWVTQAALLCSWCVSSCGGSSTSPMPLLVSPSCLGAGGFGDMACVVPKVVCVGTAVPGDILNLEKIVANPALLVWRRAQSPGGCVPC